MTIQKKFCGIMIILMTLCLNGLVFINLPHVMPTFQLSAPNNDQSIGQKEFSPYDIVRIQEDSDFASYTSKGDGSLANPYILENFKISNSQYGVGIYVTGTTAHFKIKNCRISLFGGISLRYGIYIESVADNTASVINNTCYSCSGGIYINDCSNVTLKENFCFDNEIYGIVLYRSNNCTIANNTCADNGFSDVYDPAGLYFQHCTNMIVQNNTLIDDGLYIYEYESELEKYASYHFKANIINNLPLLFSYNESHCVIDNSTAYGQIIMILGKNNTICHQKISNTNVGIFLYNCSECFLYDLKISNNQNTGIYFIRSTSLVIWNITIANNRLSGLKSMASINFTLENSTINTSRNGIISYYSRNAVIRKNIFCNNEESGVNVAYSRFFSLKDNLFSGSGLELKGSEIQEYNSHEVYNNSVNNRPLAYFSNTTDLEINDDIYGQIIFCNCSHFTVEKHHLSACSIGLTVYACTNFSLTNSIFKDNFQAIFIAECNNYLIGNCSITHNTQGIFCTESYNGLIVNNSCCTNSLEGFYIDWSNSITIANNNCSANELGIGTNFSTNMSITNNICMRNSEYGIYTFAHLMNVQLVIENNVCTENEDGLHLTSLSQTFISQNNCSYNRNYGLIAISVSNTQIINNIFSKNYNYGIALGENTLDNIVCNNVFEENKYTTNIPHTSQAMDNGKNNMWHNDTEFIGNYWSDYSGIGSYSIDGSAGAFDMFPRGPASPTSPTSSPASNKISGFLLLYSILALICLFRRKSRQ